MSPVNIFISIIQKVVCIDIYYTVTKNLISKGGWVGVELFLKFTKGGCLFGIQNTKLKY